MTEVNGTSASTLAAQYQAQLAQAGTSTQLANLLVDPAFTDPTTLSIAENAGGSLLPESKTSMADLTPRQQDRMMIELLARTLSAVLQLVQKVIDLVSQKLGGASQVGTGSGQSSGSSTGVAQGTGASNTSDSAPTNSTSQTQTGSATTDPTQTDPNAQPTTWIDDIKGLIEKGSEIFGGVTDIVSKFSDTILTIGGLFLGKGAGFGKIAKRLGSVLKKLFDGAGSGLGKIVAKGKDIFKGAVDAGKNFFKKIF